MVLLISMSSHEESCFQVYKADFHCVPVMVEKYFAKDLFQTVLEKTGVGASFWIFSR